MQLANGPLELKYDPNDMNTLQNSPVGNGLVGQN